MISNRMLVDGMKQALAVAFKTWLDENKDSVLKTVSRAIAQREEAEKKPSKAKQFFTAKELAARWGLHPVTVLRLLRKGKLPSLRLSRRRLMVTTAAVEKYEAGITWPHRRVSPRGENP